MTTATAPKIVDIYCRISVDYDGTTRSVDSQEDDCRMVLAELDGAAPGEVWKDHAKSGWKRGVVRESFLALMERLESGAADGVVFYDVSRFTRKPMEAEKLLELADRGVMVLSVVNTYDLTTAIGRKNFRDEANAAAYESDKIHERSVRGKKKRVLIQGRSNGTRRGYARPGLAPKPEGWQPGDPRVMVSEEQLAHEREVVREIARRYLAGEQLGKICRDLNERGEVATHPDGWAAERVRRMFKDGAELAGFLLYHREIVPGKRLPGEHALDEETYYALQARIAAGKRGRPIAATQLLSGHAKCGRCGYPMHSREKYARSGKGKQLNPDGTVRRQYYCAPPRPGRMDACGGLSIDQGFADAFVKAAAIERLNDPANHVDARRQRIDAEAAPLLATLDRLAADERAIASKMGERGLAWVEAASASIWEQRAKTQAKLDALTAVDAAPFMADAAELWRAAEQRGDMGALRDRVRSVFPNLTILPVAGKRTNGDPSPRIALDGVPNAEPGAA